MRQVEVIANLLDNRFSIFGFRFGWDAIIGLVPQIGDLLTALVSMYLVWVGVRMNLPREAIGRMVRNIVIDFFIGLIPILGDTADFVYRPNMKNLKILREYMNAPEKGRVIIPGENA